MRNLLVVAALLVGATGPAPAQDRDPVVAQAIVLIDGSPLLNPTMSVVREAQFVARVRQFLADAGLGGGEDLNNATDAQRALEAMLGFQVTAEVNSFPSGLVVTYRRLVDGPESDRDITTDSSVRLFPAAYLFSAVDVRTGETETRRVSCSEDCTVTFDFRNRR